jgi:hypothetical protein
MDVRIKQLNSTVRAINADSLLTPDVVDRLAQAVAQRFSVEKAEAETRMRDAGIRERRAAPDRLG